MKISGNTWTVKLGWATVFAIATSILLQGAEALILEWGYSTQQYPIFWFQVYFLLSPIVVAGLAYFLYFRRTPLEDGFLEAGLIGLYLVLWTLSIEIIRNVYWLHTYSSFGEYFSLNNGVLDLTRYLPVTMSISPFLTAYFIQRTQSLENTERIIRPPLVRTFTLQFGFGQTILGAFLAGFVSGMPAIAKFPMGVVILPFLILILGGMSRSRLGLIVSGPILYSGHILALAVAYRIGGGFEWSNFIQRVFLIDLLFFGWWFAILPVSGIGLLGRIVRVHGKFSLAIVVPLVAVLYGFLLFQIEIPNVSSSYQISGTLNIASTGKAVLTLPLPVIDGKPVNLKPCNGQKDSAITGHLIQSAWGPAWEAEVGQGDYVRCLEPSPQYPHIVPLWWVRQDSTPVGKMQTPFKLTSENEKIPISLDLILLTNAQKSQALSPFVTGIRINWSSFNYGDRMQVTTIPQNNWQAAPIVPGPPSYNITEPKIYISPFG